MHGSVIYSTCPHQYNGRQSAWHRKVRIIARGYQGRTREDKVVRQYKRIPLEHEGGQSGPPVSSITTRRAGSPVCIVTGSPCGSVESATHWLYPAIPRISRTPSGANFRVSLCHCSSKCDGVTITFGPGFWILDVIHP